MVHRVTLIPGDSTGPEVAKAALRLVAATGVDIAWEEAPCGVSALETHGSALPASSVQKIRETGIALKGRLDTPVGFGYESPNVRLRKELGLFAIVRPIRSQLGFPSRYEDVNVTIVREATEDVYSGIEHQVVPGVVQSIKITTRVACERIVHKAFEVARREGKTKVTLAHKANIMKKADGLFLDVGKEVSKHYPDITFEAVIADNACMQLVKRPNQYGVIVAQNLFGDLLSDLCAGLVGGIANVSGTLEGAGDVIVFEAIHGIANHLDGKGVANPMPFIRPTVELLRHLGETAAADRIDHAISATLQAGIRTRDLGGDATTEGFVDGVIKNLG